MPAKSHARRPARDAMPWWRRPLIIMGHQYTGDAPKKFDPATLEKLIRWKRSLGFDTEHLLANYSMLQGAEGGDDSRAYLFRNRHGCAGDLLGPYLPLAHKHGLRVIVYFNCHWFRTTAFARDWFLTDARGELAQFYGSGGGVCVRGPFRDWSAEMAEDLGRYPIDGVFLDGPAQHACFCANCRRQFQNRYGVPMPTSPANCPADLLEAFADFPIDAAIGYVRSFAAGLARTNPDAILYNNDVGPGGDGRLMRATADCTHLVGSEGGFVGYRPLDPRFPFSSGLAAKVLGARAATRGRVVFSDCGYKSFDYHVHPKGEIARMYAGTIASGASPWFLVLRDGADTEGIRTAVRFNRLIAANREALADGESLAEAAILHSPLNLQLGKTSREAGDDVGRRETARGRLTVGRHATELEGVYAALARSGYPLDVVEEDNLLDGTRPGRVRLLILPAVAAMSDATADAIRAFVADGGRLLATFDTSLFDQTGRQRRDFALVDVFGAKAAGGLTGPSKLDYLAAGGRNRLTEGLSQATLPCPEYWRYVKPAGGAKGLLDYHHKMQRRYALLPPVSDHPAAVYHKFGKGASLLIPSAIGDHYRHWGFPDHRRLLANAATMLSAPPVQIEGGGEFVEATLRRGADGSVVLHLTNWASAQRPSTGAIPLGPLSVSVRLPRGLKPKSARRCFAAGRLAFKLNGRTLRFTLRRLEEYEMIVMR